MQLETTSLLLEKAPQQAAPSLALSIQDFPEAIREKIVSLLLEKAPHEAAYHLALSIQYFPERIRGRIAYLLLKKAPQQAALNLVRNIQHFPEKIRDTIAQFLLKKAPQQAALSLASQIRHLSEKKQEEIIHSLLEEYPQESIPYIVSNIEVISKKIAHLLLEKAPQEAARSLLQNLRYLPETTTEEIEKECKKILQKEERKRLTEAEERNPTLYEGVKEDNFLRKKFQKTGSETFLLGKELMNKAILRIIPRDAFVTWLEAYGAVEIWKSADLGDKEHNPIEPILKARMYVDDNGEIKVRAYAGVLGVSAKEYLNMYSNEEHHEDVKKQIQTIIDTLRAMGINHGHLHSGNFCVLHERTPKNEIDWDKPPRVYCIDFDRSTKTRTRGKT
jgi:hypothetical protein